MADSKNPDSDMTGTEKTHDQMGTPPGKETPRQPVDEKVQEDAAEERKETGGYQ